MDEPEISLRLEPILSRLLLLISLICSWI